MTDGPDSALRPIYCGTDEAVKDRNGVATLSSRAQGSAK